MDVIGRVPCLDSPSYGAMKLSMYYMATQLNSGHVKQLSCKCLTSPSKISCAAPACKRLSMLRQMYSTSSPDAMGLLGQWILPIPAYY